MPRWSWSTGVAPVPDPRRQRGMTPVAAERNFRRDSTFESSSTVQSPC